MKKIMFYINTLGHGGAERVMSNLATQFSQRDDYRCTLVTSFPSENEYPCGEKVCRISLYDKRIEGNFWKRNIKLVQKLRRLIKTEKPDVLVSFMAEPNFRALLSTVGTKTKNIISVRNDPNKEYAKTKWMTKTLYRFTDGIVFQTQDAKDWFPKGVQKNRELFSTK
jgi:hypothetical protein